MNIMVKTEFLKKEKQGLVAMFKGLGPWKQSPRSSPPSGLTLDLHPFSAAVVFHGGFRRALPPSTAVVPIDVKLSAGRL